MASVTLHTSEATHWSQLCLVGLLRIFQNCVFIRCPLLQIRSFTQKSRLPPSLAEFWRQVTLGPHPWPLRVVQALCPLTLFPVSVTPVWALDLHGGQAKWHGWWHWQGLGTSEPWVSKPAV